MFLTGNQNFKGVNMGISTKKYKSEYIKYFEDENLYEIQFRVIDGDPVDDMLWSGVSEDLGILEGEILNTAIPITMTISFERVTLPIEKD